ncbi:MAG: response regulator, partial [Candidatus Marinimicrobia bacterium]|nr:response regulator [Candidatus Neomarinimicrobiota bacterium]
WLTKILECDSETDLVNKNVNDLEYGMAEDREEFIQKLLSEESIQHYQTTWKTKSGDEIQIRENAHIIRSNQGEVIFYEGTVEDITDQVHLQEQLRQSQKMEAVGQLAGGIAHDFNNLLTVINGYSGLLISQVSHLPEIQEDLQTVHDAGIRAEKLTRQLLAFSRRQQLQPVVLNVNDLILDLKKMLTRIIGEHIHLHTDVAEDIWPVKVDPGQMEQVIINLAVNARDAMPGGGQLHINTRNVFTSLTEVSGKDVSKEEPFVEIEIRDTGRGMPEETVERIFEPFYTTKEKGKGTGLGLATVYGIIKQSGGDIRVDSTPDKGTSFTILIPKSEAKPEETAVTSGKKIAHFAGETILLAEDEETVRDFIINGLESHGLQVITARNGEDALDKFEERSDDIDLVITDVVMPKMSGPELIREMNKSNKGLPVIYISGYSDEMLIQIQQLDDLSDFVQKPFTIQALLNKIMELLEKVQSNERIE